VATEVGSQSKQVPESLEPAIEIDRAQLPLSLEVGVAMHSPQLGGVEAEAES
jgi:hypothetical protein